MFQGKSKVYRDDDPHSFEHLRNKYGQFNLKEVAEHLEKTASAFTQVINKLADVEAFNDPSYLSQPGSLKQDKSPAGVANSVNAYGENAARRTSAEVVNRNAPLSQQSVINNEDRIGDDKNVYPKTAYPKTASEPGTDPEVVSAATGVRTGFGPQYYLNDYYNYKQRLNKIREERPNMIAETAKNYAKRVMDGFFGPTGKAARERDKRETNAGLDWDAGVVGLLSRNSIFNPNTWKK